MRNNIFSIIVRTKNNNINKDDIDKVQKILNKKCSLLKCSIIIICSVIIGTFITLLLGFKLNFAMIIYNTNYYSSASDIYIKNNKYITLQEINKDIEFYSKYSFNMFKIIMKYNDAILYCIGEGVDFKPERIDMSKEIDGLTKDMVNIGLILNPEERENCNDNVKTYLDNRAYNIYIKLISECKKCIMVLYNMLKHKYVILLCSMLVITIAENILPIGVVKWSRLIFWSVSGVCYTIISIIFPEVVVKYFLNKEISINFIFVLLPIIESVTTGIIAYFVAYLFEKRLYYIRKLYYDSIIE